jgi:hypothetical protein
MEIARVLMMEWRKAINALSIAMSSTSKIMRSDINGI